MDELQFWKTCCQRGITICDVRTVIENERSQFWLVQKFVTFGDRQTWKALHKFKSADEMVIAVERYLETGVEPSPSDDR